VIQWELFEGSYSHHTITVWTYCPKKSDSACADSEFLVL